MSSEYTGSFGSAFGDEFLQGKFQYVTVDFVDLFDQHPRPGHPPYPPLWRRFQYPRTPKALLLWKTGEVKPVDSLHTEGFLTCDACILGGYKWWTEKGSWEATVLENAGYTLVEIEPPAIAIKEQP